MRTTTELSADWRGEKPARTVLITGANKGIGLETARQLGGLGYGIWLGCRDDNHGRRAADALNAAGVNVRFLPLNVTDHDSISAAARIVQEADGMLDVLINNAGILGGERTYPRDEGIENIRSIYETNVFGVIRVTQAFVPLLAAVREAQVAMVGSGLASLTLMSDRASRVYATNMLGYISSKTALNAIAVSFSKDLAPLGIRVNVIDPGYTATDLNNNSGPRTVSQAADSIVRIITDRTVLPSGGFFYDGEKVPW